MTEKLLVIKTRYKLVPSVMTALGVSPRGEPETVIKDTVDDKVGVTIVLGGTRVNLVEDGAIVNGRIHMSISPKRRTGGCLIDEYTSLKVEPIKEEGLLM